ncbi:MAG: hypothetical protein ACFFD4_17245 [Candidatus Odinarchaeota archaeon]
MVNAIYIVNKFSGTPVYTKTIDESSSISVDDSLVGGFVSAITQFAEHLQIGNITKFDTANHEVVVLNSPFSILAIVFDPLGQKIRDPHSLAGFLLEEFERRYPELDEKQIPTQFDTSEFDDIVDKNINQGQMPFFYRVMEWSKKEFSGEIYVRQEQFTADEKPVIIDLILDRGEKTDKDLLGKITDRITGEDFSRDVVYVKIIDGLAGSGEIKEFFETCATFGRRRQKEDAPSYFPTIGVVVAKSFSSTVPRIFESYRDKGNRHYLIPKATPRISRVINRPPKNYRCHVQCWKWEKQYPELVYE